jgi:selenocysteine-specific elongation factor
MRVIGTAGHVDHGKSALVQALTGIHPDRLKEEREREMTIDLGFAWLTLPKSDVLPEEEQVGIIDVPGHRDFIENMLAGVGGIDAVLFVVAADEGVMPQTREHLAILDLLQIQGGVVALTKIDLIEDDDWLDLVEDDLRHVLAGTVLEQAPVVRVSARSGAGIPQLVRALSACLADRPPRPDLGRPRLPVDRVFTIAGFGTVVTGTLSDGVLQVGDEIAILGPGRIPLHGRVRGLQTHKRKESTAVPGSRTAVNITGVTTEQARRGDVLAHPGDYRLTRRLDVRFRLLPDVSLPLHHNTQVKFFIGAAEVLARVRLLGYEELPPGGETWLQLELKDPVVAIRGDRYILRRPSPGETLGGGVVVDPDPKGRHKRFDEKMLQRLDALTQGTPAEVLFQALAAYGAAPLQDVIVRSNLDPSAAESAKDVLLANGQMIPLEPPRAGLQALPPETLVISEAYWRQLVQRVEQIVAGYHRANPLRRGMPREELKSRLKLSPRLFNALTRKVVEENLLEERGPFVAFPRHQITFTLQQQRAVADLMERFAQSPFKPPTVKECAAEVGEDVLVALIDLGDLVVVSPEVLFRAQDYQQMLYETQAMLNARGTITAAELRDHFDTSRRYALAFLEYLDAIGVTVREGDARRLKQRS